MRHYACMIIALAMICGIVQARAAATPAQPGMPVFFHDLNDVPLMPGLTEVPEEAVVFDKPEGRIVQAGAQSVNVAAQAVSLFYDRSLPPLGWQKVSADTFTRDKETLKIKVESQGSGSHIQIVVTPG